MMLLTWANIAYYQELMQGMRKAIASGSSRISAPRRRNNGNAATLG